MKNRCLLFRQNYHLDNEIYEFIPFVKGKSWCIHWNTNEDYGVNRILKKSFKNLGTVLSMCFAAS